MSNKALNWAWDAPIPPGPKFVLVALADHATDHDGEDWTCFPSSERLMAFTGYPSRTLERHLAWLWKAGWYTSATPRGKRGKMQVRRYTLHRDADIRDALAAEREGGDEGQPPANMAGGETADHPPKEGGATRQNGASPPANMAGGYIAEPPEEPLVTPTERAGASATGADVRADWMALGWSALPDASRKVSSQRLFGEAWAVEAANGGDPKAMAAACLAFSGDKAAWGVSGQPCSAHRFMAEGRWKNHLGGVQSAGLAGGEAVRPCWSGPAEVRAAFVAAMGEAFALAYLDPATWRDADSAVIARTGTAADRLRGVRPVLADLQIAIINPVREVAQ